MTDAAGRPVVRLRPKVDPRPLRRGFPWVYADQLVTDRRTRALAPGSFAMLEDAERRPLGLVTVNPASKIVARMMDPDPAARIDAGWIAARIDRALALRRRLYAGDVYRLVHAEADGLPGMIVDRFGDVAVLQPNAAWAEAQAEAIAGVLVERTGVTAVVKNAGGRARAAEGLDAATLMLVGDAPGIVPVAINGAVYMADVLAGQKTGLFLDQKENQAFAARLAADGGRVLDVFCHVGGFALAALAGGAGRALAVDASERALELAADGAAASGVAGRFGTRRGDGFEVMAELAAEGAVFDLAICDPPAFAPSKQALAAGLRAYERIARLAAPLVAPGGFLVLCSCSHAVGLDAFRTACLRGIGRAGRGAQIVRTGQAGADHPVLPQLAESGYLKALFFRLDG